MHSPSIRTVPSGSACSLRDPGKDLEDWRTVFSSHLLPLGFDGSKLAVFALNFDRDGSLWVGTLGNGLFRIRGNVVEHYGREEGLSSDLVNDLFEDREGILWVTTTNGIDSFREPRVVTFSTSEGFGREAAVGVLASKDGTVWVANAGSLEEIKNGLGHVDSKRPWSPRRPSLVHARRSSRESVDRS